MLHRPTINGLENIWLMESLDLLHWGRPVCVMQKGDGGLGRRQDRGGAAAH